MNTSTPEQSSALAPQESTLAPLEKTPPKLNLPPKPILASSVSSTTAPTADSLPIEPPPITIAAPAFPLLTSASETISASSAIKEKKAPKKKFSIGLLLAFLMLFIALLAFLMQLRLLF